MIAARNLLLVVCSALATSAHASFGIFPATPTAGQDFVVTVDSRACNPPSSLSASIVDNTVFLDSSVTSTFCFSPSPPVLNTFVVRGAPAGTYDVVDRMNWGGTTTTVSLGQVSVKAGTIGARPGYSLAGLWWVPEQPGWALNVVEGSAGQLFLVWYAYAASSDATATRSAPTWSYVPGGQWTGGDTFTGPVVLSIGPVLSRPFDPRAGSTSVTGLATLTVISKDTVRFSIDPKYGAGYPANVLLTRYQF